MASSPPKLRSPRATLGGYVILPRLIDKVRLHAHGKLPAEYEKNLLKPGLSLDGRFLSFTNLDGEQLRHAVLAADTDDAVLAWVEQHARRRMVEERQKWAADLEAYRPNAGTATYRRQIYPVLAKKVDVAALSVFDLIDMDEGRISIPGI